MNPIFIPKCRCRAWQATPARSFLLIAGALLLLAGATTSCHTTRGIGRDVEEAWEGIQEAVRH